VPFTAEENRGYFDLYLDTELNGLPETIYISCICPSDVPRIAAVLNSLDKVHVLNQAVDLFYEARGAQMTERLRKEREHDLSNQR
jgi:hypothetical protein